MEAEADVKPNYCDNGLRIAPNLANAILRIAKGMPYCLGKVAGRSAECVQYATAGTRSAMRRSTVAKCSQVVMMMRGPRSAQVKRQELSESRSIVQSSPAESQIVQGCRTAKALDRLNDVGMAEALRTLRLEDKNAVNRPPDIGSPHPKPVQTHGHPAKHHRNQQSQAFRNA